jgi:hypothetical protein
MYNFYQSIEFKACEALVAMQTIIGLKQKPLNYANSTSVVVKELNH